MSASDAASVTAALSAPVRWRALLARLSAILAIVVALAGVASAHAEASGAPPVVLSSITDLGTLGGTASHGGGIDAQAIAVGDASLDDGASFHAFFGNANPVADLGTLRPGPSNSLATAINPSGDVVAGWSETTIPHDPSGTHQSFHATRWRATTGYAPEDLGTLQQAAGGVGGTGCHGGLSNTTAVSWARAVNGGGTIVGVSDYNLETCPPLGSPPDDLFPFWGHAFRFGPGASGPINGSGGGMEDLGTLDDALGGQGRDCAWSSALAINKAGAIVGFSGKASWGGWGTLETNGVPTPCVGQWDTSDPLIGHAYLLPAGQGKGGMIDLGEPAGGTGNNNYSEAAAINDAGVIALNAKAADGVMHAYRYDNGVVTPLGSLGGDIRGTGINASGDITGSSLDAAGNEHAILYRDGRLLRLDDLLPAGSPWQLLRGRGIDDAGDISGTGLINGATHAFLLKVTVYGVDILTGPTGTTAARTATFEFSHPQAGVPLECSLDGAPFAPCSSPITYSALADGPHSFRVRAHPSGHEPGTASERTWTVDDARPAVLIDSAPTGSANGDQATIRFHGSKPDLTFVCQLDDQPSYACGSPQNFSGLLPGAHQLSITASDDLGHSSTPTIVTWTVGEARRDIPPATTACAAGSVPKASSGMMFVIGRSGTCLTRTTVDNRPVWKAGGPVTLNGILIAPDAGASLTLSATGAAGVFQTTGPSTITVGALPPESIASPFEWDQDATGVLTTAKGPVKQLVKQIGPLDVVPVWPTVDLLPDNGGSMKITLRVSLPKIFTSVPGSQKELSADFALTASNDNGVFLGGKIRVGQLWLGPLSIKDLELGYDDQTETFDGALGLLFGGGPTTEPLEVRLAATIGSPPTPALLGCCLRKASIVVQAIDKEIPNTPLYLQKIGGEASREVGVVGGRKQSYLKFGLTVGVSIGPYLPFFKTAAVNFEGTGTLSLSDPWQLELSGKASLLQYPLANAKAKYVRGVGVTLQGNVHFTLAGYGVSGAIRNSFFEGRDQFNVEAVGDVTLPVLGTQHAEAVFSTKGFAACTEFHGALGDYSIGWGVQANGTQVVLADVCDLGPFRAVASASAAPVASAQRTLTLAAHRGPRLIAVRGRDRAPDVKLTGPGGLALATGPAHAGAKTAAGVVIVDDARQTTYLLLARSPAGTYRLTSPAREIIGVRTADALAPVRVQVHARAAGHGRRTLTYRQRPAPGQQLELYEQGRGAGRLVVRTTRRAGSVTYTPSVGLGARRSILAVTTKNGLERDRRTLARYVVDDARPGKVSTLRVRGRRLTWAAPPRAVRFAVGFTTASGATPSLVTAARDVAVPHGARTATVAALDGAGRAGSATAITLAKPRPSR